MQGRTDMRTFWLAAFGIALAALGGCKPPVRDSLGGLAPVTPRPLTAERARKMTDEELEETVSNFIGAKLDADREHEAETFARLPTAQKAVLATIECDGEVDNGGFVQYFWNGTGRFAREAAEGYRQMNAPKHASIVEQAIALWKKDRPVIEAYQQKGTTEAFSESYKHTDLTKLDDPFYKADDVEKTTKLRATFIRAHLTECLKP